MPYDLTIRLAPVPRPRMTERLLSAAAYPLTLVIAPAGYGKTTALRDLLAQDRSPSVFVATPQNADLELFVQSFAKALSAQFPEMATPPNEKNAGSQDSHDRIELYAAWANAHLHEAKCTIVIDDLQYADSDVAVAAFLARLVEISNEGLRWIFSSRTNSNLPITRWQAYGLADAAITAADLSMRPDEAASFAKAVNSPATTAQIDEWVILTQGFPVPLAYAIRLSASRGATSDIIDGTRAITFSFLAEQLWKSLSEEERDLLEVASFLPSIHMHQYEDVGIRNATAIMSKLCEQIAFIALSPTGMFSMHDLFRDFLRQQLSNTGPTKQRRQLKTAATLLLNSASYDDAFTLLIKLGSPKDLCDAIEQYPSATCNLATERSIVELTERFKPEDLGLRLLELHIEHSSWIGNVKKSQRYSQEILRRPTASPAQIWCAVRSMFRTVNFQGPDAHRYSLASLTQLFDRLNEQDRVQARAYQASLLSRYPETQDEARSIAQELQNRLSGLSPQAHIDTLIAIGTAYFYLNEDDAALSVTREAVSLAESWADARERARALNNHGQMLDRVRDPAIESLFQPLRDLVERTGSWRFSHISHWLPAQYYALQANLEAMDEALVWQSATIVSEESEKRRLSSMRRHCLNLRRVLCADYGAIILDHTSASLPKEPDIEYDHVANAAVAFGFMSNITECEKLLARLKQLRVSLPPFSFSGLSDAVQSEIIAMCIMGRWAQARQLNEQVRGKILHLAPLENALALLCQGPPFLNLLAALEPCFNKPYVGFHALLIKRIIDHEFTERSKQPLTSAETDVLRLIMIGKSNKEIASTRARSEETIKRQVTSVFRKLRVENRTSAVAVARERGIL